MIFAPLRLRRDWMRRTRERRGPRARRRWHSPTSVSRASGLEVDRLCAESALRIVQRAIDDRCHVLIGERVQHEDARAREERRVHFKRRVLGRRADHRHRSVLDIGQNRVLLPFVEAMDLVDEEHAASAHAPPRLGLGDDAAQIRDTGAHRGKFARSARRSNARRSRRASSFRCRADPRESSTGRGRSRSRDAARGLHRRSRLDRRTLRASADACALRAAHPARRRASP